MLIDLPIFTYFDQQRFKQFNPTDAANWTLLQSALGKKEMAMLPAMGRVHVQSARRANALEFENEPRELFESVNYAYAVVNGSIYRIDKNFNRQEIAQGQLKSITGDMYFAYLVAGTLTYVAFTDTQAMYLYEESGKLAFTVVPPGANGCPMNPQFIAAFGNRFVVSQLASSQFSLTEVNLAVIGAFDINKIFIVGTTFVFAQEVGVITQMAVLQNTLYIFSAYRCGIWSNRPSNFISAGGTITSFPFQRNTSTEFDFGMADPKSLDVRFNRMAWVGQSSGGQVQALTLMGSQPQPINSNAVDVLFQDVENALSVSNPFVTERLSGFLYQYENRVFYRLSAGNYDPTVKFANPLISSIEYNYAMDKWSRCIEADKQRNRAQRHIFFANMNLVTVQGEKTVYELSGNIYFNEITNPANTPETSPHDPNYYIQEPMRYEAKTPIITIKNVNDIGYAEFETEYVEIDFAFGMDSSLFRNAPMQNAEFIVSELLADQPVFIAAESENTDPYGPLLVTENSNYPVLNDKTYFNWFKPSIELKYSNDGGISYQSADEVFFSDLGIYKWRMRWYNVGYSRNRSYYLIGVSRSPLCVLGGVMKIKRISGGAD
jgi:hypothetical protein